MIFSALFRISIFRRDVFFMDLYSALSLFLSCSILLGGLFFTFYLKGFFFIHPRKTLRGLFSRGGSGRGVSPLRALSASLAGSLGVGNIAGVAVALMVGGAGAVFWMWASALISMVLKYCEITLGVKYRTVKAGELTGGPMYYMEKGVGGKSGRVLAALFAAACVVSSFALGNIVQVNAALESAGYIFGWSKTAVGAALAAVTAAVILGGFSRISRFTSIVLPVISGAYIALCLAVVIRGGALIPSVTAEIFSGAFRFDSAFGGVLGFLLSPCVAEGVAKGTFSHESGSGTAPLAHAGAEASSPGEQGLLGIFEVFLDTIIICTLTAYVLLIARRGGAGGENGMAFVLSSFELTLGAWTKYAVGASVCLFALSTLVCWAFYGRSALSYLTSSKYAVLFYTLAYLATVVFAASLSQGAVWRTADASIALMTGANLPSLFLLRREIKAETEVLMRK
jgi:AGCS family alanine or glycine:cation symporter